VTTTGLDELFISIHAILNELMPVKNLFIALYDPRSELISFPYYIDQYDEAPPPGKLEHGLTEYVLRTKEPLWATEGVFSELVKQGEVEVIGTDSVDWIGVPLFMGDRVTGVMVTQSYTEGVCFTEEHFDLMKFISTQVALAIEHKLDLQRIADGLEYNKTLINSSSLGIRTYDSSGQCILANESIARILGTTREQCLSENYNQLESWKETGLLDCAVKLSPVVLRPAVRSRLPMHLGRNCGWIAGSRHLPPW
jgi:PAS domain-containing protein